jgi:transcriptional regulator with XRE-family HTH domain
MNGKISFSGEQLRLARLAHGWSLETLGEMVGATRQYLHLLETGARNPAEDLAMALCDVLGVSRLFLANPIPSEDTSADQPLSQARCWLVGHCSIALLQALNPMLKCPM